MLSVILSVIGLLVLLQFFIKVFSYFFSYVFEPSPKSILVDPIGAEALDSIPNGPKFDPQRLNGETKKVYLWDPSNYDYFGELNAMTEVEVNNCVKKAREAQSIWKNSSFATRRLLMRTMLKFITENQEQCAKVAVRDSGKTVLDALIGEIYNTISLSFYFDFVLLTQIISYYLQQALSLPNSFSV
jgi:hypothetical protein